MAIERNLAYRMRPKKIEDVVGQQHLLGEGRIINRMVRANRLTSMILYGPPGVGKTSIANALAGSLGIRCERFNASKDDKKILSMYANQARITGAQVIILLDEIHRLDKAKQDFLLSFMENSNVIIIGSTTENPYISIRPAIRSRCQIFELKPVLPTDIETAVRRAIADSDKGLGKYNVDIKDEDIAWLSANTNGDVRSALNGLELAVLSTAMVDDKTPIDRGILEECIQRKSISGDKNGDSHYDTISAFQKSIRGSDTDAGLHYLAKILDTGDLEIACRRLLVIAYEDIGLANPQAGIYTQSAIESARLLGLPEARIPLADAVIYLCLSPKSNTGVTAIDNAMEDLNGGYDLSIPADLRDAHYKGANDLGHGKSYVYPHDYMNDWYPQQYLPTSIMAHKYAPFSGDGKTESSMGARYDNLKKKQLDMLQNHKKWDSK